MLLLNVRLDHNESEDTDPVRIEAEAPEEENDPTQLISLSPQGADWSLTLDVEELTAAIDHLYPQVRVYQP